MIVVADTSPLNYLVQLGHVDVLRRLYGRILAPHAVRDELIHPRTPDAVRIWALNPPDWLELLSPATLDPALLETLDLGEAEAITLADQLKAEWLLIDDDAGRTKALGLGLQIIGTLGILREAARLGEIDLPVELTRLRGFGFYVSDSLIAMLLDSLPR